MSDQSFPAKNLREQKNHLRSIYYTKRQALAPNEKARRDKRICTAFLNLVSYRYAKTLLLYHPLFGEVDTRPIIARALADKKAVKNAIDSIHAGNHMIVDGPEPVVEETEEEEND